MLKCWKMTNKLWTSVRLLRGIWLLTLAVTIGIFTSNWQQKQVIDWDIAHYYSYLPATFIYQDFNFNDSTPEWTDAHFRLIPLEHYGKTAKMTSGVAIMNLPFFLGAHYWARYSGEFDSNGFSPPYRLSLLLASLLYSLLGIYFLSRWLKSFYPDPVVLITTFLIFFGTNLLYYSLVESMSHAYSFCLLNLLLYLYFQFLKKANLWRGIAIGLLIGMLILIRPTNLILLLFPFGHLLLHFRGFPPNKILWYFALMIVIATLPMVPQLIYWHHMTGRLVVYSYPDEGFFLLKPMIWKGLFGYRSGWFIYSPALLLAIPGFYWLWKKHRAELLALLPALFIGIWVIFSWWCWWYGGSFGARAMIEYLPLMALPMAASFERFRRSRLWLKIISYSLVGFLCFWSIFMNWQYSQGYIHYDAMTKEVFWSQFLKSERAEGYWKGLDHPDYDRARHSRE